MIDHLRWPRLIFFQLTSALSIVVVGLSSWGLAQIQDKRIQVKTLVPGGKLHVGDILATGAGLTAASGLASLACSLLFLITLFRLHKRESKGSVILKEVIFGFCSIAFFITAIAATVVTATRSAVITSDAISAALLAELEKLSGQSLAYKDNTPAVSSAIVAWFAWLSSTISFILVSLAARKLLDHGQTTGSDTGTNGGHETLTSSSPQQKSEKLPGHEEAVEHAA